MKTMLASLLVSDANVLMLDEPTNFLDLSAVEALEGLLKDYPGTVVFVSHDRRLIEEVVLAFSMFMKSVLKHLTAHMKRINKRTTNQLLHKEKRSFF